MRYLLKDLLKIRNGKDHKQLADGPFPVYGSGGIMRYASSTLYDKASILLPRKGTLDNIQFANTPFWTVDTLYYTEIDESMANPYFLFYYLKQLDISHLWTGTGVPSMTNDAYYQIRVSLPILPVQHRIAGIIGCIIHCLLHSHQEVFAHHQEADGAIYILRVHPLLSGKLQRQVVYCAVRWSTLPQNVSFHDRATSQ